MRKGNAQGLNDLINIVFLGAASLGESDNFPQQANAGRLYPKDHEKYGQQEHRPPANGVAKQYFLQQDIKAYGQAKQKKGRAKEIEKA